MSVRRVLSRLRERLRGANRAAPPILAFLYTEWVDQPGMSPQVDSFAIGRNREVKPTRIVDDIRAYRRSRFRPARAGYSKPIEAFIPALFFAGRNMIGTAKGGMQ